MIQNETTSPIKKKNLALNLDKVFQENNSELKEKSPLENHKRKHSRQPSKQWSLLQSMHEQPEDLDEDVKNDIDMAFVQPRTNRNDDKVNLT